MNQTEKKKKAILETTFKLLNEKEVNNVTIDEIADQSEVSKVTLFKYFGSKNNLVKTVIFRAFEHMAEDVKKIIASNLDFESTYRKITDMKLEQLERYSHVFTENLMTEYSEDPNFFDSEMIGIQSQVYEELFQKGKKEGKIAPDLTQDDFMFILNIFIEGMKGLSAERLFEKTPLITNFFIKGFA